MLEQVGFQKVELVGETGFNSTPKTKGVLLRAEKPTVSAKPEQSSIDALYSESKTPVTGYK